MLEERWRHWYSDVDLPKKKAVEEIMRELQVGKGFVSAKQLFELVGPRKFIRNSI